MPLVLAGFVRRKERADDGGDGLGPREGFGGVFRGDGTAGAADFGGVAAWDVMGVRVDGRAFDLLSVEVGTLSMALRSRVGNKLRHELRYIGVPRGWQTA